MNNKSQPPSNMPKSYFGWERSPKGWIPVIFWKEKPPEIKKSRGDQSHRTPLIEVTHISRLYKAWNINSLLEELIETYPAPKEIGEKEDD